jgi:hypothetical protein
MEIKMNGNNQMEVLREDILKLYDRRKNESDPGKIHKLEEIIAVKLKAWGEMQNRGGDSIS